MNEVTQNTKKIKAYVQKYLDVNDMSDEEIAECTDIYKIIRLRNKARNNPTRMKFIDKKVKELIQDITGFKILYDLSMTLRELKGAFEDRMVEILDETLSPISDLTHVIEYDELRISHPAYPAIVKCRVKSILSNTNSINEIINSLGHNYSDTAVNSLLSEKVTALLQNEIDMYKLIQLRIKYLFNNVILRFFDMRIEELINNLNLENLPDWCDDIFLGNQILPLKFQNQFFNKVRDLIGI